MKKIVITFNEKDYDIIKEAFKRALALKNDPEIKASCPDWNIFDSLYNKIFNDKDEVTLNLRETFAFIGIAHEIFSRSPKTYYGIAG